MLFERIDRLRRKPRKERERFVAVVSVGCVIVITAVWFLFTIDRF